MQRKKGVCRVPGFSMGVFAFGAKGGFFTRTAQAGNDTLCVCWSWWDTKKDVCVCSGGLPVAWSHVHVTKPGPVHSHMQGKSEKEWKACLSSPLYVHEPAVCVWGLPWQPRPHPLFLPSSAYESHLCRPLISISTRSPLGLYAVCVCFWTEITGRERWCREQRKHGIITTVKSDFGALIMMICAVCALQIHANANRYSYFH